MSLAVILIFVVLCALLGYRIISAVPPLLHTPLMSGMNALSGITLLVALAALRLTETVSILAVAAVVLATVNVVGGFSVTGRMLRMFRQDAGKEEDESCGS